MQSREVRQRRRGTAIAVSLVLTMLLSALGAAPRASAASPNFVAGNACAKSLTPTWMTGDTWIMYGNVTVPFGCRLTIEPGAFVRADAGVHLYVHGQLLANGTATSRISFDVNVTNVPWAGIQFNRTSTGSYIEYATIHLAATGVKAVRSSPILQFDVIDHAFTGIDYQDSSGWVGWSTINYTANPIRANGSAGSPVIVANTITTVLGNPIVGIYGANLNSVTIQANTIRGMYGVNGTTPAVAGARGPDGGSVVAIAVNASVSALLAGNTIDRLVGGRGGDGAPGLTNGGNGGDGGTVFGLLVTNTANTRIQNNGITNLIAGHGGNGGAPGTALSTGGAGGNGGNALAMQVANASVSNWWFFNTVSGAAGGSAGNGGAAGSGAVGAGGAGGNAYALIAVSVKNANASNLGIQNLRGGFGGNSSNAAAGTAGGPGGQANGLWILGIHGYAVVGNNTLQTFTGGQGGSGRTAAGAGGAVTAILLGGDRSPKSGNIPYNLTTIANNQITGLTGGVGGLATQAGPPGGTVVGMGVVNATLVSLGNSVQTAVGGMGGSSAVSTNPAGPGGDALGFLLGLLPTGKSRGDAIRSISAGARGTTGSPPPRSHGVGIYVTGNRTLTTRVVVTNGTIATVSDFDLLLDVFTATTTLNTTFSSSKLSIGPAANLTVKNFLAVKVFWPNNATLVSGASITVTDNAATVFGGVSPTGAALWIPVTNRVYVQSTTPRWNTTAIHVAYLTYTFASEPRTANMTASQTQYFTMVDSTPPTSSATALPAWESSRSFTVHYTYSDGFGVGVKNVTLWYNLAGAGWVRFATQAVTGAGTGQFVFSGAADGTYQFATTAIDNAANGQTPAPPVANNTWTIVDTVAPGSHVNPLPAWETSLSFSVSWAPNLGTTDVAFYAVQYDAGAGWLPWLADTTATSGTFTATSQGVYQFRTLAHDFAGNTESKTGNDTWTVVDTIPPTSSVLALPGYERSLSFGVWWAPTGATSDIATYALQVSVDGGAWVTWFSGATNTSATFAGATGHRYAFRSLAMDRAGNIEAKTGNDTWTIVDTVPPTSAVASLPRYENTLAIPLSWGPTAATTDIATYTIQVRDNGGAWTDVNGSVNTVSRTTSFVGQDGHTFSFRSLATDRAGNVETKTGNDTFTTVDVTRPHVVSEAPQGSGVNGTPAIVVTFSEPMNPQSTQLAFSLSPTMDGTFAWNNGGTVLTFTPARSLNPGTQYTVIVGTSATDIAGNALSAPGTFSFTTAGSGSQGFNLIDWWPLFLAIAVAAGAVAFFLLRRRGATAAPASAAPATPTEMDDVFLLYKDGILIKHETLRLRPDIDTDILSGMLTAVQQFVKDSFQGDEEGELNEITVGQMHLHIGKGKWLIIAARVSGGDVTTMNDQIRRCIQDMEDHHWDQLEEWDGDMALARILGPYLKKLIHGDYGVEPAPKG